MICLPMQIRLASVKFTIRFNATFLLEKNSLSAQRKPKIHRSTDRHQLIWHQYQQGKIPTKIGVYICVRRSHTSLQISQLSI